MISKAKLKYIHALEQKKIRQREQLFVAEGPKVVGDLLAHAKPRLVVGTKEWMQRNADSFASGNCRTEEDGQVIRCGETELLTVSEEELCRASFLQHPQEVLAVFPLPEEGKADNVDLHQLVLALDGVQDPGNLGTIIRVADWFGIKHIVCSRDTADAYNPKVVQATMGSIARVRLHYTNLAEWTRALPKEVPVYGLLLDGDNIYKETLTENGVIVMGNEGNGLSAEMRRLVTRRLFIPSFPPESETAESLNVAIATAVTCAEFRRRSLEK
ncbi:MAG: RNA methyltransferase [Prevotella sp.]|jgi:TrmH family RNA methyltransferase